VTTANDPWGRVDADGTVYVRTADGERVIGSWAAGSPEEAIAFFRRKFESLETEVTLIEQRITTTDIAPAQAQSTVQRLLKSVADANALGDLDGLRVRLEALTGAVDARRPDCSEKNEAMTWALQNPRVTIVVRQLTGAIARRIVAWANVGDELRKGDRFGMIRFGSRTEVYLPLTATVLVKVGEHVSGGSTIIARLPDQ